MLKKLQVSAILDEYAFPFLYYPQITKIRSVRVKVSLKERQCCIAGTRVTYLLPLER